MAEDIREVVKRKPYRLSKNTQDFLSDTIEPVFLADASGTFSKLAEIPTEILNSIRGVSFFAVIKALEEVGANGWFLDRLRLPGTLIGVNPDAQRVVLAMIHGLHAFFASSDPVAPKLTSPLPTRIRYVLNFTINTADRLVIQRIYSKLIREYLKQPEDSIKLDLDNFIKGLKTPIEFINHEFLKSKTGSSPVALEDDRGKDTDTVRDFYVQRIPLINDILPRRPRRI